MFSRAIEKKGEFSRWKIELYILLQPVKLKPVKPVLLRLSKDTNYQFHPSVFQIKKENFYLFFLCSSTRKKKFFCMIFISLQVFFITVAEASFH